MPEKIKVMIADDHKLFSYGIQEILKGTNDIRIVAQAENGLEAIELAKEHLPDVILMDVDMPQMNGIEATKQIKSTLKNCKIIALTMHMELRYLNEMRTAGVNSYVIKSINPITLVDIIRNVYNEKLSFFHEEYVKDDSEDISEPFTSKEIEILTLLTKGHNNKKISKELSISENTVKNHISNMLKKINAEDRTQLVIYAFKHDLVDDFK